MPSTTREPRPSRGSEWASGMASRDSTSRASAGDRRHCSSARRLRVASCPAIPRSAAFQAGSASRVRTGSGNITSLRSKASTRKSWPIAGGHRSPGRSQASGSGCRFPGPASTHHFRPARRGCALLRLTRCRNTLLQAAALHVQFFDIDDQIPGLHDTGSVLPAGPTGWPT